MTATTDGILAELQDICRQVLENPSLQLTPETTAEDVPNWDSFAHLNIVVAVEQRFGLHFRTSEVESLKNVGDFVEMIRSKRER
ncbi:MAG TPA: acyl carrier protein [Stellaceae bacterium]|nr:acyl carrier protein [Stellaceae bacterium]